MGLKEINYKDAMEIDFIEAGIIFEREKRFAVKDKILRNPYYADFVVFENILIEVKSATANIENHLAQALSYLAVSGMK
jgi:GxxExxY protein